MRGDTAVARFERAVDALIGGDLDGLRGMLREHPELVGERSSRAHGCTLLHHVSANGFESYRQKTPPNIVEITKLLLERGADVDAIARCYGGDDDTLGLTATSAHPANAGVMIPMLETLVAAGARINGHGRIVWACLANGQPEAARWLAEQGADLDLADAAGIGRVDVMRTLITGATPKQLEKAFRNASWYREADAIRCLLDGGFDVNRPFEDGSTALHQAAEVGDVEIVELLLARGARTDVREPRFVGTPWDWAEHASRERRFAGRDHAKVMALLRRP
jgi:ankyrin repeat protein